ncbi:VanZ family protein [Pontibacter toksunensis]|uniref:VanZ family protein n=1 Tax=Pontibacter toksunensis TaxID=1332631 RepID=A0ABW6C1H5_9BACT
MNLQEYWGNNRKHNNTANKLTFVLFIVYLMALIWILLFKLDVQFSYTESRRVNLIPFSEPLILNGKADFGEMLLNVVIFLPLGIYAGILFKRWIFGKKLFFFFLITFMLEGIQFLLRVGAFDITDITTNTLGGVIGSMIYKVIEKVFKSSVQAQKFMNIIAAIGTVLMISLLLLLKMDMLPVKYK